MTTALVATLDGLLGDCVDPLDGRWVLAWERIAEADPGCLHAAAELAACATHAALQARDSVSQRRRGPQLASSAEAADANADGCTGLAEKANAAVHASLASLDAYESAAASDPSHRPSLTSAAVSAVQRTLCESADYCRLLRAALELMLGLIADFCPPPAAAAAAAAAAHYERSARLDGSDRRLWQLWAASVARTEEQADLAQGVSDDVLAPVALRAAAPTATAVAAAVAVSAPMAVASLATVGAPAPPIAIAIACDPPPECLVPRTAAEVHRRAVARGLWLRQEQRPLHLIPSLAPMAMPWWDPMSSAPCRALQRAYETIRGEAAALGALLGDGGAVNESNRADASVRGLAVLSGGGLLGGGGGGGRAAGGGGSRRELVGPLAVYECEGARARRGAHAADDGATAWARGS